MRVAPVEQQWREVEGPTGREAHNKQRTGGEQNQSSAHMTPINCAQADFRLDKSQGFWEMNAFSLSSGKNAHLA